MAERNIRRVTRGRVNAVAAAQQRKEAEQELDTLLQSIANNNADIERMAKLNDEHAKAVEALLLAQKMHGYTNGILMAEMVQQYTRKSSEIDVAKLQKKMKPADFLRVVKAQVAELKKFMSENEINEISDITPPVKKGVALAIRPVAPVAAIKPAPSRKRST